MSAFGIRPALTAMADRIAAEGYTVLVPNVLYRYGRTPIIELPEPPALISTAADPTLFQRLGPMIEALTPELFARDADAYLGWLAASPLVTDGPVGITGYCLGAGLALRTAGAFPDRVAAAAGFHGAYLATDSPDSPHLVAERVTAELYFGHADQDPSLPAEEIDRFAAALAAAGVKHTCEVYEGARHGFTQTDTVPYHPEGTPGTGRRCSSCWGAHSDGASRPGPGRTCLQGGAAPFPVPRCAGAGPLRRVLRPDRRFPLLAEHAEEHPVVPDAADQGRRAAAPSSRKPSRVNVRTARSLPLQVSSSSRFRP
ncbi:dienelactone hydrolase family protein [Kitasatospora aburaviensis]